MPGCKYEGSIASVTPTVCELFGIAAPSSSIENPLARAIRYASDRLAGGFIERCLIYCPDALGDHLWDRFPDQRERITQCCPQRFSVAAVVPPKTPVCFASVFTGAPPEVHGIRRYERPTLTCDTLFDALVRAGRRVAIIAVRESSIDLIFRHRPLDYFSEAYVAHGKLLLYQTLESNEPAVRIALSLGCERYATHLAVRLKRDAPDR